MKKSNSKSSKPIKKRQLHPRNRHRDGYDFDALIAVHPVLKSYVGPTKYGSISIDFFDPAAVKALNTALLMRHYAVDYWDIPDGYLCPPIPGRADHIHHSADLLSEMYSGPVPRGSHINCLDIGVGANCIYPLIGHHEYGWTYVGTDTSKEAIASANDIVAKNPKLVPFITTRHQPDINLILEGIINTDEYFDIVICNPPFHQSAEEAERGTTRKLQNLKKTKTVENVKNFGGQHHELWYPGGEREFIKKFITESKKYQRNCLLYTTLVSKEAHLDGLLYQLAKAKVTNYKVVPMGQGNKTSHLLSWTYLNDKQRAAWIDLRWHHKG